MFSCSFSKKSSEDRIMTQHSTASSNTAFFLDTNVILHNAKSIYDFGDSRVVIPITVIAESDSFKKGHDPINVNAREFARLMDQFDERCLFDGGASLGERGRISVCLCSVYHCDVQKNFPEDTPDHRIINSAYLFQKDNPDTAVVVVSKDVNIRLKAKSLKLMTDDYTKDHATIDPYQNQRVFEDVDTETIAHFFKTQKMSRSDLSLCGDDLYGNQYVMLRNGKSSALASFDHVTGIFSLVEKKDVFGVTPRNAEQTFSAHALLDPDKKIVALMGRAGTGKTLLALASSMLQERRYDQILLSRPIIGLSGKDLGYLPGDVQEKIDPFMRGYRDNLDHLSFLLGERRMNDHLNILKRVISEKIKWEPLAYIRSRSLNRTLVIVDEAQNLTPHEIKTILTRAGEGSKMVIMGDVYQIDNPYLHERGNGLIYAVDKLRYEPFFAYVNLIKGERSEIASRVSELL